MRGQLDVEPKPDKGPSVARMRARMSAGRLVFRGMIQVLKAIQRLAGIVDDPVRVVKIRISRVGVCGYADPPAPVEGERRPKVRGVKDDSGGGKGIGLSRRQMLLTRQSVDQGRNRVCLLCPQLSAGAEHKCRCCQDYSSQCLTSQESSCCRVFTTLIQMGGSSKEIAWRKEEG